MRGKGKKCYLVFGLGKGEELIKYSARRKNSYLLFLRSAL